MTSRYTRRTRNLADSQVPASDADLWPSRGQDRCRRFEPVVDRLRRTGAAAVDSAMPSEVRPDTHPNRADRATPEDAQRHFRVFEVTLGVCARRQQQPIHGASPLGDGRRSYAMRYEAMNVPVAYPRAACTRIQRFRTPRLRRDDSILSRPDSAGDGPEAVATPLALRRAPPCRVRFEANCPVAACHE
jgi:hypothetical protein